MFTTVVLTGTAAVISLPAAGAFKAAAAAQVQTVPAATPSPTAAPLREIGHVTTSDRRTEPIGKTSRPTFIVDRARIQDEGARTLADALQNVPGVELFAYGPFGAEVDYGIRGAISTRTLVLVDGQPIADPTTGTVDLAQVSTVGVERIEVVESAASSLYGTSASGGVINVITSVPRDVYVEGSLGSFADRDLRVAIGDGRVGASFERHVATSDFPYPSFDYGRPGCMTVAFTPCNYAAGLRNNDYGDQSVGRASTDISLGGGFRLRTRGDIASLDIGVPNRLDFLTPNTTYRTVNNTGLIELERTTPKATLSLDLSGAAQRASYFDPSFGSDDVYWGRSQLSLKDVMSGAHADMVAGVDLSRSSGIFAFPSSTIPATTSSPAITTPSFAVGATQSQTAAYVQIGATPLSDGRVTGGLRAEHDAPAGSVLAPSFGAVFGVAKGLRLAGNVSESYDVPTLQDLYYPGAANPNLQPEKSQDSDVTLAYGTPRTTLSVGWFARNGSNFIVFDPVRFIPVNAQRATLAGVSAVAQTIPFAGWAGDFSVTDLYRALDLGTGARLPRAPVVQASAGMTKPFGTTRTAFGIRFGIVGSDGDDAANVPPPIVGHYDSYSSLDAYARFRIARSGILSLRGFNLANDREAPVFGYPNVGRRFSVELATQ